MTELLLAFFGDDFTGSTDALESLTLAGARTVLFMEVPTPEQIERYGDLDAIGVAGITRSLAPEPMEAVLEPALEKLADLRPRHVHYKICSTFDSSPSVGNIGKVLGIALKIFPNKLIPILVAAPWLGRYMVFGNLFARMGIGSEGSIYRLDRHPSMSHHPVTPGHESDLRLHLSRQTDLKTALVDIIEISKPIAELRSRVAEIAGQGYRAFFLDAMEDEHLSMIGAVLDGMADNTQPHFSLGSSGIGRAIGKYYAETGRLVESRSWPKPPSPGTILVISGSFSPVTAGQVEWALLQGFKEILLDMEMLGSVPDPFGQLERYHEAALKELRNGSHVIIHAGRKATSFILSPVILGGVLGKLARDLARPSGIRRMVISGGDTSGYAARAMGIESMEVIMPMTPGAPLCKATAPGSSIDGLEVIFKGGQVGGKNYFGLMTE